MDRKDGLDVISIAGMAGIGKTTFARKTYEHEKVVSKFKFRFWIDVTENFNKMEALHYILKKITGEAMFPHGEDYLITLVMADGLFRILKRINDKAYKVDLPGQYSVSAPFNVADLSPYQGGSEDEAAEEDDADSRLSLFQEGEYDAVPAVNAGDAENGLKTFCVRMTQNSHGACESAVAVLEDFLKQEQA